MKYIRFLHWTPDLEITTLGNRFSIALLQQTILKPINWIKIILTFHSTSYSLILVSSTSCPKNIVRNTQSQGLYFTAREPPNQQPRASEVSTYSSFGPD